MAAETWPPPIEPLLRSLDLNVGESCDVKLSDGNSVAVKLLDLTETRDDLRQAVREARVTVELNGQKATLTAGNYRLPITLGGAQVDCAVTKGCVQSKENPWALEKDARLRLWPAGSPWIQPGTFMYPAHQRWFASMTQMANEPVFVDGIEDPARKSIYYHYGLDIGGAEGLVDVLAAADAVVIMAGPEGIKPPDLPSTVRPRYDEVFLRDGRGWYYCYAHLLSIDPAVKPGAQVKMGQKIGVLGKEGSSGGWSHLHFHVLAPQPSGRFGILEGYAFLWQAYHAQRQTQLQAVARPHHLAWAGEDVVLDGSLSWSAKGPKHITSYQWILSNDPTVDGPTVTRRYAFCGEYCEILKVTDADGRVDYDFAVVQVLDRQHPQLLPPAIHAVYWPTFDLKAGDEVTFKVRSFGDALAGGHERWNFGDGGPPVDVQSVPKGVLSDTGKSTALAKDGYAITTHRYAKPGDYLVSVSRTNSRGQTATAGLHVHVEP
jgi:murein DD-endopeptidase MepM/ murein hydrolase activator NlpD